jgi:hypothetical protein
MDAFKHGTDKKFEEAGKEFNSAVNQFDKTVEKKAAETKGWFGGLFGGK